MTANQSSAVVQCLWNYLTILRDAGLSYGDYVEQNTYLFFLKIGKEHPELGISHDMKSGAPFATANLSRTERRSQSRNCRALTNRLVPQQEVVTHAR